MAALEVAEDFDTGAFRAHMVERLPGYARPVFLRIVPRSPSPKPSSRKNSYLAQEGFDPAVIPDPLYADCGEGYVPLDPDLYARINSGLIRL